MNIAQSPRETFREEGTLRIARLALRRILIETHYHGGLPLVRLPDKSNAVLMFHSIGDKRLPLNTSISQMQRIFEFLTTSSRIEVVDLPRVLECSLSKRKVAVTFDDGFLNFYENALPLIRKFEIPSTVFVNPGLEDDSDNRLIRWRHEISIDERILLNDEELRELAAEPLVTIGNHTQTHPPLDLLDSAERREEIRNAKFALENTLGVSVSRFCYPYGRYDDESIEIVRESHDYAVTTIPSVVTKRTDKHLIPRVPGQHTPKHLFWQMTRVSDYL